MELKYIYSVAYLESPNKLGTSVSFIEQSTSMMGASWRDSLVESQMELETSDNLWKYAFVIIVNATWVVISYR